MMVMRRLLDLFQSSRTRNKKISDSLARDLGAPAEVVSRILEQTSADLRQVAAKDEAADPRPVINRAIEELGKYGYQSNPVEEERVERFLSELPERELTMLRHFKQGKKHREIAALMGTDVGSVRCSLVKIYADLRMKMRGEDGGGGGDGNAEQPAARSVGQTSIAHGEVVLETSPQSSTRVADEFSGSDPVRWYSTRSSALKLGP